MKKSLKKIVKKIPLVGAAAKLVYDWRQEKKLLKKVDNLLRGGVLRFTDRAPERYAIGYESTIRCNLKCKMCYQGQTRAERQSELDTNQVLAAFEKLEGKSKEIKLVGGEPFVRQDIFQMIDFWQKAGKRVILQTNCTLLDEKAIEKLKKFSCVSDILTSLDGPQAVHDSIRGVPGTFSRLKKAIELLRQQMPQVNISAFATLLISDNLDKFFELIDTTKALGLDTINILFEQVYQSKDVQQAREILKTVFGWQETDYRLNTQTREELFPAGLTLKSLKKKLSAIRRYGLRKKCFVNFVPYNYYKHLDRYINGGKERPFCLKLLSSELRVNQRGEVIWCDIIEKSFGSLLEKSPDEIWLSKDYQKFREYLFKKSLPICQRCCKAIYVKN